MALTAAPAYAENCTRTVLGAGASSWNIDGQFANIAGGTVNGTPIDVNGSYGYMHTDGFEDFYDNGNATACTYEEGGQETAFPEDTVKGGGGLLFGRKVYVPAAGTPFVRILTTMRNPSGSPVTVGYGHAMTGNSFDEDAFVLGTASGDLVPEARDAWIATSESAPGTAADEAALAHVPDTSQVKRLGASSHSYGFSGGDETNDYRHFQSDRYEVTVPANSTVAVMHLLAARTAQQEAVNAGPALAAGPDEVFAGLSASERDQLQNWSPGDDADRDGVPSSQDNCDLDPNANQVDTDGDGQGNACDGDDDGDGLSDELETQLGLNPTSRDSDGDGIGDNGDRCPTTGGTANGCPVTERTATNTVTTPGPVQVVTASQSVVSRRAVNSVSITPRLRRSGRTIRLSTAGLLALPAGMNPAQTCSGGAVAVTVKTGKRTISTRFVDVLPTCRFASAVRFSVPQRLVGKSLNVQAIFLGNNFLTRKQSRTSRVRIK